jgi:hypothetical protein
MYSVDDRDKLIDIEIPPMNPGTPAPAVQATDGGLLEVTYLLRASGAWYDLRFQHPRTVLHFDFPECHYFGPPSDETLRGHPLADRGLKRYRGFQVIDSSWIRGLEQTNRVHPGHNPGRYDELKHYIITFHSSTFECVARGFAHKPT